MSHYLNRIPRSSKCIRTNCVYNKNDWCNDIRTNRGNTDALCHGMTKGKVIRLLYNGDEHPNKSSVDETGKGWGYLEK